ncbi:unnamed protein product [Didymodactylos carnosus]|uniref:Uncharacterized protein n=1 Tax=Didymodactylos carnosus TaxID=1234261 RepID=A0A8S2X3Q7_9BILA|nr:unnamed protein product [Didymodactylos carnosus]CAF4474554.1 unnamed protein product [Didymodactylos carnosus]
MERWCKVMCIRHIIETEHSQLNENEKDLLFKQLMKPESVISKEKLDKFMISREQMFTICMTYTAHHDSKTNWSSFTHKGSEKWKELNGYIDAFKNFDDNQNYLVLEKCISQYSHLFDDPKYPNVKPGVLEYLTRTMKETKFINLNQFNELKRRFQLTDIQNVNPMDQISNNHDNYETVYNVLKRSLSTSLPRKDRSRRHRSDSGILLP